MAAKTPKKFRQARKAAKVDAKKVFSGAKKASLKDKSPLVKFSADDKKALSEMAEEARNKYITDDKGNKIKTTNITTREAAAEYKSARKASNEAFRSAMRAEFGEYAGKKATQSDYDSNPKFKDRAPKTASSKPTPKITEAGKVRSAVTATEPKPQSYKVDKTGKKIKEGAGRSTSQNKLLKKTADKTKAPVVKKGFAAGKELNAEGKAIYDKLVKEGVKPKSALNKALFRQEKGAKVAAKAAGPVATAAKSAASKVKKQGPVTKGQMGKVAKVVNYDPKTKMGTSRPEGLTPKVRKEIQAKYDAAVRNDRGMTPRQEAALQRRVRKEDQRMAKLRAADPKKFDAREALARNTKITPAEYAKERAKIGDTVRPKPAVAPKPGKFKAMQDNKQKLSTSKELVVRPKAGPVVAKTAAKKAGAKAAFKTAALGAAKSTGKLFTSKAGLAITAASLLGKPVLQALTKEPAGAKKAKINAAKTPGPEARSNQPRITGQGKFVGVGAGGSTYRVNAGDTLSGIAKKSGVTLSELMAANKKIKDPRKIYRNTAVNIPSKGKVPTGGYAGPVPYRPKKK